MAALSPVTGWTHALTTEVTAPSSQSSTVLELDEYQGKDVGDIRAWAADLPQSGELP